MSTRLEREERGVFQDFSNLGIQAPQVHEEDVEIKPEKLTLVDVKKPEKDNDPFKLMRENCKHYFLRPEDLPDFPEDGSEDHVCLDLSHMNLRMVFEKVFCFSKTITFVDLSFSQVYGLPPLFYNQPIATLILRGCQPNLIYKMLQYLKREDGKRAEKSVDNGSDLSGWGSLEKVRQCLELLDVSEIELEFDDLAYFVKFFPKLKSLFVCKASLAEIPFSLTEKRKAGLNVLDFSHNQLQIVNRKFWTDVTMLQDLDVSRLPVIDRVLTLEQGLEQNLVMKDETTGAILARDNDPGSFQLDLRGNPLLQSAEEGFSKFPRVKISDQHQLVFLPNKTFIYADLPKPVLNPDARV